MKDHSNALNPAQYAEFGGIVQSKLWPAIKGRVSNNELQEFIDHPERVMLRLRKGFIEDQESNLIMPASPFFAKEEVQSDRVYPEGYFHRPVCEQLVELSKHFNGLNTNDVLACSKELPALPAGAEGWFAMSKWQKIGKTYNEATELVMERLAASRQFKN